LIGEDGISDLVKNISDETFVSENVGDYYPSGRVKGC
jgi:hypothetical protein